MIKSAYNNAKNQARFGRGFSSRQRREAKPSLSSFRRNKSGVLTIFCREWFSQLKDIFDRDTGNSGHFEGQDGRGNIDPVLDRVDGLAGDPDPAGSSPATKIARFRPYNRRRSLYASSDLLFKEAPMFIRPFAPIAFGLIVVLSLLSVSCGNQPREENLGTVLEREIPELMKAADVPGLSMAVVQDGRIFWDKAFGVKSRQTNELVDENTMFEAASLTKTVTAYAALRLVERGELDLDKPLYEYFPNQVYPKLSGDERYKKLTARLVLTHTTGLPNWGNKLMRDPGLQYGYSGEGFLYLGRTIEQISGVSLQEFARKEVFEPLGMGRTSYLWNEGYAANGACGHDERGTVHELRKNTEPNGGASLLTTASDYAAFICALLNSQGLSNETIDQMTSPQVQVTKSRETTDLFENVFWGWGWGIQPGVTGHGFWHWGDNGDLRAYTVTYKDRREGFVYFANSENGLAIAEAVTALVFPDHQYALDWLEYEKYDNPKRLARLSIETAFMEEGIEAGLKKLQETRQALPDVAKEETLTEMARYLGERGKQEEAVVVLNVCLESYPQSVDARLGLGLAYLAMGRNQAAIECYEAALKINKDSGIAKRGLEWANDALQAEKNPFEMSVAEMEILAGDYGPRHIKLREGQLYYQRDGRPEYRLLPLRRDTFALERYGQFRIQFVFDEAGQVTTLVGLYIQGNTDKSPRDR
jgi:CubicO group peptidase (beta-lactamase class C family)